MALLDMSPLRLDVVGVRAGDANARVFTLLSDGRPWDLTGCVVSAQARARQTDPDPPALTAEVVVLDAAAGRFSLTWPGDDVSALLADALSWSGVWDLQVAAGSDPPVTVLAGSFRCDSDVTR